jgi:non-canonical purine NTP pyrophosphatase (RdgB/HAM1 family)
MDNLVYVTGNPHKAKYFAKMTKLNLPHIDLDLDEIQSTSLSEIVEHKARQAYALVNKPVVVEDTKLSFGVLGALPGTLIKWFQQEIGETGLCRLLDGYDDRSAFAGAAMAYFDGTNLEIFERELEGTIARVPSKNNTGFGWNTIFMPKGMDITFADMSESEFEKWYAKVKPFDEITAFLKSLDTK